MTDKLLPNGLTQAQVDARPEPYVGMIFFDTVDTGAWFKIKERFRPGAWHIDSPTWGSDTHYDSESDWILLPGEASCPWPPPPEFRHKWQAGDRAWVLHRGAGWICVAAIDMNAVTHPDDRHDRNLNFCEGPGGLWCDIETPALYIPSEAAV